MSPLQQTGPFRFATGLAATEVVLDRFDGEEGLSMPFLYTVDMLAETKSIQSAAVLRQPMVLELNLGNDVLTFVNGLVRRFTQLDIFEGLTRYRAEVVPSIWFMSLVSDCRIYHKKTAVDIIGDVLQRNGVTEFKFSLVGGFGPTREYTVQYRENDLQFICRLMQEEGLFYFFQHFRDKHVLVISDNNTESTVAFIAGETKISAAPGAVGGNTASNAVTDLRIEREVATSKVSLVDFNPVTSPVKPFSSELGPGPAEVRDYPGKFDDPDGADRYTRIRLDSAQAMSHRIIGTSNCRAFTSGCRFDLVDFYRADANLTYQLVRVRHTGTAGATGTPSAGHFGYTNQFIAIPASVTFRPTRTIPRPYISGTQTALVVGADGTTNDDGGIVVDKFGRVKVKFHWAFKTEVSADVRVASTWAGKQWGQIQIPRVGQEVIVAFEEGDPDRPIIVGRVYNADEMPPYNLPDNKTQSGIKSRSSPNGGTDDFNELRFEDKKGSEQIVLHAQKDLIGVVENDRRVDIGGNDTLTVEQGKQTINIKKGGQDTTIYKGQSLELMTGDQEIAIDQGNHHLIVNQGNSVIEMGMGDLTTTVKMGNYSLDASLGNVSIKADLGQITIEALQGIEIKCGPMTSIKLDPSGVTISAMMVKIDGQVQTQVSGLMAQLSGTAMTQVSGAITMIG